MSVLAANSSQTAPQFHLRHLGEWQKNALGLGLLYFVLALVLPANFSTLLTPSYSVKDAQNRLTTETITGAAVAGVVGYGFDLVGNRLSRTSTLAGVPAQTSTYDNNDRILSDTFDNNGSTLSSGGNSYTYDAEAKLVSAVVNGHNIAIVYDGDGNRVQKTVDGVVTTYLVDTNNHTGYSQVLEEKRNGVLDKVYTYGLDLISQDHIGQTGLRYFGYDGLGSTRNLTDANGAITDNYQWDAYGNSLLQSGGTSNSYLYSGEQFDADLGLEFLRARYLDSRDGRFLTSDVWEGSRQEPISLHKYLYASLMPANRSDPSGQRSIAEFGATLAVQSYIYVLQSPKIAAALFVVSQVVAALLPEEVQNSLLANPNPFIEELGAAGKFEGNLFRFFKNSAIAKWASNSARGLFYRTVGVGFEGYVARTLLNGKVLGEQIEVATDLGRKFTVDLETRNAFIEVKTGGIDKEQLFYIARYARIQGKEFVYLFLEQPAKSLSSAIEEAGGTVRWLFDK